jgi:hypothetical protein
MTKQVNDQETNIRRAHLFFSSPVRKAASASEARRLPLPASLLQTAYSLTKAYPIFILSKHRDMQESYVIL